MSPIGSPSKVRDDSHQKGENYPGSQKHPDINGKIKLPLEEI
jgi:hypothetical protein